MAWYLRNATYSGAERVLADSDATSTANYVDVRNEAIGAYSLTVRVYTRNGSTDTQVASGTLAAGNWSLASKNISVTVASTVTVADGDRVVIGLDTGSSLRKWVSGQLTGYTIASGTHTCVVKCESLNDEEGSEVIQVYFGNQQSYVPSGLIFAGPTLGAPASVTATRDGREIDLSWGAVANATSYTIQRKLSGGTYADIATGVTGTSYTDTAPPAGICYYQVKAVASGYTDGAYTESSSVEMPFQMLYAAPYDATHVIVKYNGTAPASPDYTDYTLDNSATISAASRVTQDTTWVNLTTSELTPFETYTLDDSSTTVTFQAHRLIATAASGSDAYLYYAADPNVVFNDGYIFGVWYNTLTGGDWHHRAFRYDIANDTVTTADLGETAHDDHIHPTILIDPTDDKVVVIRAGRMVGTTDYPLAIAKSATANSLDFGAYTEVSTWSGTAGDNMAYATATFAPNGTLFILGSARNGTSPPNENFSLKLYRYLGDTTAKTAAQLAGGDWFTLALPVDDESGAACYQGVPRFRDGRLGVTWVEYLKYDSGMGRISRGVGYLYSDDAHTATTPTWKDASGTTRTVPLAANRAWTDVVYAGDDYGWIGNALSLDSNLNPTVAMITGTYSGGDTPLGLPRAIALYTWDGSAWDALEVTHNHGQSPPRFAEASSDDIVLFNLSQMFYSNDYATVTQTNFAGSLPTLINSRPTVADDGTIYVLAQFSNPIDGTNKKLVMYTVPRPAEPPSGVTIAFDGTDIDVTFTDNSANESGVKWKVDYGSGYGSVTTIATPNTTSFSFTPTEGWTSVKVAVASYNDAGDSAYAESNVLTIIAPAGIDAAVTLDAADLVQHHVLAAEGLTSAVALDAAELVQHAVLAADGITCAVALDAVVLTQYATLTVDDLTASVSIDGVTLGMTSYPLTVAPLDVSVTIGDSRWVADGWMDPFYADMHLTQHTPITTQDITAAVTVDAPTLVQHHALAVDGITAGVTVDGVVIIANKVLAPADLISAVTIDTVALTQHHTLVAADVAAASSIDAVTLTYHPTTVLVVDGLTAAVSMDAAPLTQHHTLTAASISVQPLIDGVVLVYAGDIPLGVADVSAGASIDVVTLTQHHALGVQEIAVAVVIDGVAFTLPTPPYKIRVTGSGNTRLKVTGADVVRLKVTGH